MWRAPPQIISYTFNSQACCVLAANFILLAVLLNPTLLQGKVTSMTGGYVCDNRVGNTKGLGGLFGCALPAELAQCASCEPRTTGFQQCVVKLGLLSQPAGAELHATCAPSVAALRVHRCTRLSVSPVQTTCSRSCVLSSIMVGVGLPVPGSLRFLLLTTLIKLTGESRGQLTCDLACALY